MDVGDNWDFNVHDKNDDADEVCVIKEQANHHCQGHRSDAGNLGWLDDILFESMLCHMQMAEQPVVAM